MGIIDNKNSNTLANALKNALTTAKAIDIATGYFFFSGFHEVAEEIRNVNIRIIVGMDIDPKVVAARRISDDSDLSRYRLSDPPPTNTAKIANYKDSFIALFNNSDIFDRERLSGTLEIFFQKIKDGTLEIKMNLVRNHGKYYLVHNRADFSQVGANPGTRFMGSSNFTISGLKGQGELMDRKIDPDDFNEYMQMFNNAWDNAESISVLDKDNVEDFLEAVKLKTSLYELPQPYIVYLRILKELFDRSENSSVKLPSNLSEGIYKDLKYQEDAVIDALDITKKYNGVIIADVVGLGKSIIASAVAANLDKWTIIITPPHLKQQWETYIRDFNLRGEIYTAGKIEQALRASKRKQIKTIIIDEAHRYRNEDTDSYQALHKLCLNNKVILLTATPFNNDPKDLFALIKLFDTPSQSKINTVDNLSTEFRSLITEYQKMRRNLDKMKEQEINSKAKTIAHKMRSMVSPVIIRRTRVDLNNIDRYRQDLNSQGYEFPVMSDPELLKYNLGNLAGLYSSTLEKITEGFSAARYQPSRSDFIKDEKEFNAYMQDYYEDPDYLKHAQANLANVMRRLLVVRFESSVAAFSKTLDNFIEGHNTILQWYEKFSHIPVFKRGNIPDSDQIENAFEQDETLQEFENITEKAIASPELSKDIEKGLIIIPVRLLNNKFIEVLKSDLKLLKDIKMQWEDETRELDIDPKVEQVKTTIIELLKENANRKIVIFTTYTDTADYLEDKLRSDADEISILKYTGSIASAQNQQTVKKNFDAGLPEKEQENEFNVLVATDVISEGYNLHRAGVIINYDIPYNPVKVVQRVGRINRVNKRMFDRLLIFNCFPTFIGENEVAIKKISSLKINLMHELMGTDTKILTEDEAIQTFFVDKFNEANKQNDEQSWDVEYLNHWNAVKYNKTIIQKIDNIKQRTFLARRRSSKGMLLFGKRSGGLPVFVTNTEAGQMSRISVMQALEILRADEREKAIEISQNFESVFQDASNKLFQQNQLPKTDGRRRKAIDILEVLKERYSKAKPHCEDAKRIIKDLDGFPEGLLKKILDLRQLYFKEENFEGAYEELQSIAPVEYMVNIQERVQIQVTEPDVLLIAEELI